LSLAAVWLSPVAAFAVLSVFWWGGPAGPQPAPWPASGSRKVPTKAGQGPAATRGGRPTHPPPRHRGWEKIASMSRVGAGILLLLVALIVAVVHLIPETGSTIVSAQPPDGHQRMLQLLEQIRARTAAENHYLGDDGRQQAESQLAKLPRNAP